MNAMPRIGTPRRLSASIDNRLWLIVPSAVRATTTTGAPQCANRSANSNSRDTGTSTPPAPSTTSGPATSGKASRARSIVTPSISAARCGEHGVVRR